jgi:hypothetical protein
MKKYVIVTCMLIGPFFGMSAMEPTKESPLQVFLKCLERGTIAIDTYKSATIQELKQAIEGQEKISVEKQRIILEGKELIDPNITLNDLKIWRYACMHLIIKK